MKVHCPDCDRLIPATDISLETGWAKCVGCQEVFALADVVDGFDAVSTQTAPTRPFDASVELNRDSRELTIDVPAHGLGGGTLGLLFFALFWLGFVCFWTAGALGVFWDKDGPQLENVLFASFSIPFWLVGFGMLGGVIWMAAGRRGVIVDAAQMQTEMRCLLYRRRRVYDREQVQCAREGQFNVAENGKSSGFQHTVEIVFEKGVFRIPCKNKAECAWLIAEVNDFLQSVPFDARARRFASDRLRSYQ